MPLTIWQNASRRCTVSINGAAIAVQLLDGEDLVQERAVGSADQALSLAELWKTVAPAGLQRPTRRAPRNLPPAPTARSHHDTIAVPRVMWVDRR